MGYGDQVGGVWRSGMWGMGIFLAKNGVYGDRGGGVWAWKGWGMGKPYPPFQPPIIHRKKHVPGAHGCTWIQALISLVSLKYDSLTLYCSLNYIQ